MQRLKRWTLWGVGSFLVASTGLVLLYRVVDPPTTPLLWIRSAATGFDLERPLFLESWTPLETISPHLIRAVITAEDQKFFQHNGFDWQAVKNAIEVNIKSDRLIGASTISMQTARNVFLWQNRDWLRKGLEAYFTLLIETFWSKGRILEVYLNVIEWGDGVFGCGPASQVYFGRPASSVSPLESAWLAAILPNPRVWSLARQNNKARKRQQRILDRMNSTPLPRTLFES